MAAKVSGLQCLIIQFLKWTYFYSLFLLLMVSLCVGLYEDQVGLFDWRQRYIGTPKDVSFDQSVHSNKRLYVSTEANVLAALNIRTGQIVWRKVFERKDGVINKLLLSSNFLLTVSGNGRLVRSWDPNKGNLLWESSFSKHYKPNENPNFSDLSEALKQHQSQLLDQEIGGLVVVTHNSVRMLSQSDGTEIWEHVMKDKGEQVFGVINHKDTVIAFCTRSKDEMHFVVLKHLDIETGKLVSNVVTQSKWIKNNGITCDLFAGKYLICLVPELRMVTVKNYVDKSGQAFTSTELLSLGVPRNELVDEPSITAFSASNDKNSVFQIRLNKQYSILAKINPENRVLQNIKTLNRPGFFTEYSLLNKNFLLAIYKDQNKKLCVDIYNKDDVIGTPIQIVRSKIPEDPNSDGGAPLQSAVYMYKKKEDISFRILLVSEDFSLSLIQSVGKNDAKLLWSRNEALSTISNVQMIELPPSTSTSKLELLHAEFSVSPNSGVLTMFTNRIKSQIRQIQTYAEQIKKRRQYGNLGFSEAPEESTTTVLKRDQFNIVKVILAYTKGRRLFAMNSQNGNIVWSTFISKIEKYTTKATIIEQRSSSHFPLPPQCLLVAPHGRQTAVEEDGAKTVLFSFNPLTGEGLNEPILVEPYRLLQVSGLPFEDDKSLKVVGLVDTQHHFHIYPDTSVTRQKLQQNLHSIYIYLVDTTSNMFKGYKVRSSHSSKKFELYEVWSVNIPSDQRVLKLTTKRVDEVVNSVGSILGDHTVMYKYLNPNLLGVMTMQGTGLKGNLFIYIIDAVTGRVVYHARHKGADSPVDLILSEHWLVYLYYNTKGRRIEISVVELFEGYEEKNHTAFSSLDPVDANIILSQAYTFPVSGVSKMVPTTTQRGITNKNILFGLDNGYVFTLPKNYLNPRRQFKQTQMLQEEGVIPYMPELPHFPQAYINYNQTVTNIRGIHTSAAGLESTSLVLVYGLDIFYTRVTPSKMFDVLKEDFDYIFISGVLSALIIVSLICSKLASMRKLKLAWQ